MISTDREQSFQILRAQWERISNIQTAEILFYIGSERFGLRKVIGEDLEFDMTSVVDRIAIFKPEANFGIWEAEKTNPDESNIYLLEDELAARNLCMDLTFGNVIADEVQRLVQLSEAPVVITSESLTRPEYEGNGFGSALFTFSQMDLPHLGAQYRHLLHGRRVIAQVVDGAKNQTSGKEQSGWTSRRALEYGYIRQPEYPKRPVWHKEILLPE